MLLYVILHQLFFFFFFFNDTATTEIYTLSLHDALPISTARYEWPRALFSVIPFLVSRPIGKSGNVAFPDRKSTRLNSSHLGISYAVFCLKKKKMKTEMLPLVSSLSALVLFKPTRYHTFS